jgi:hypothetical protein
MSVTRHIVAAYDAEQAALSMNTLHEKATKFVI